MAEETTLTLEERVSILEVLMKKLVDEREANIKNYEECKEIFLKEMEAKK